MNGRIRTNVECLGEPCRVVRLTGGGRGAIASLLVEGEGAVKIVQRWFHPASGRPLGEYAIDAIVFGRWGEYGGNGEELVVSRRSNSCIEVHCHGGDAAAETIIETLVASGCTQQSWQVWTHESTGDSIVAEARIVLATATTERAAAILLDQYRGALRRELRRIAAVLEKDDLPAAGRRLRQLQLRAALGLHLSRPWRVVLAGGVNVGKSSLINAIVGYSRAIVFDQPGTTRDVVTAETAIDGWGVELADTAGLRVSTEPIEQEGVARARQRAAEADLVVLVFDASASWSDDERNRLAQFSQALVVHNKTDLIGSLSDDRPAGLATSAKTGAGIAQLIAALGERLVADVPPPGSPVPFTTRQVDAIAAVLGAVERNCASEALSLLTDV